ncbi:MAG: hypothetical protein ABSG25_06360 [Bryobacteraceae bacterium]
MTRNAQINLIIKQNGSCKGIDCINGWCLFHYYCQDNMGKLNPKIILEKIKEIKKKEILKLLNNLF